MDDKELFKQLLGDDVEPISSEKRVAVDKIRDADVDKEKRRTAAEQSAPVEQDPLTTMPDIMVDPLTVIAYRKPGVQHGVFKNLRLGKYTLDARLDLHRMGVEQARNAIFRFIKDCVENDVRAALITHGKGESRERPALLKSCVAHWLPQLDSILAFHTAQKQHGSYGATYILLKKSEKKKLEHKELNRKGH